MGATVSSVAHEGSLHEGFAGAPVNAQPAPLMVLDQRLVHGRDATCETQVVDDHIADPGYSEQVTLQGHSPARGLLGVGTQRTVEPSQQAARSHRTAREMRTLPGVRLTLKAYCSQGPCPASALRVSPTTSPVRCRDCPGNQGPYRQMPEWRAHQRRRAPGGPAVLPPGLPCGRCGA